MEPNGDETNGIYGVTKITQVLMRLVSRMLAIGTKLGKYNG